MMSRIVRLSEGLCNQIAAGEVTERPASVVKELVENALDANATKIHVDVGAGGIGVIRVTDNGIGMSSDDAALAVERHATSKIARFEDLMSLRTFGFRGEALPSIASVSEFTLRTRQRTDEEGTKIVVADDRVRVEPCGIAPGTIVEVRELFHNVPARRKFLKSVAAEAAAITAVLEVLALACPQVTLTLSRDGKRVREWLCASSRHERVADVKKGVRLEAISGERGPLHIEAFLAPPEDARGVASSLQVLINNRVVRDRVLARVVSHAYGSVLESGKYPVGVLFLDIDPDSVDVNVHPQKAEVRFDNPRAVHGAVFSIVSRGLANAFGLASNPASDPLPSGPAFWQPPASSAASDPDPWGLAPMTSEVGERQGVLDLLPNRLALSQSGSQPSLPFSQLRFLAQLQKTYLLCEGPDSLVIIDQHAAAERVTFARLRSDYLARNVSSQRLLVPQSFSVDSEQAAIAEEYADQISETGLEIRVVGPSILSVLGVPQILSNAPPEYLARELLDELQREGGRSFSNAIDKALATMACHGSTRAGDVVDAKEAQALLAALDGVDFALHCPHGRPILMTISYAELERQVRRS